MIGKKRKIKVQAQSEENLAPGEGAESSGQTGATADSDADPESANNGEGIHFSDDSNSSKNEPAELCDADFSLLDREVEHEELLKKMLELERTAEDYKDKYMRSLADLENYKKRATKERSDLLKYQGERVFVDLLEVVDNLERAIEHSDADVQQFREGIRMIHRLFLDVLGKWEVRAESALGKQFDPYRHNAISKLSVVGTEPGTVISELKKAFLYKDKLLRPAEVVVVASEKVEPPDSEPKGAGSTEIDGSVGVADQLTETTDEN